MRIVGLLVLSSTFAGSLGCVVSESAPARAPEDAGTDAPVAAECAAPTGEGTTHDGTAISADETWTAAGSPHVVTFDVQVTKGATLTVEPCAVVRVQGGRRIYADGGAKIVAPGTAARPIRFVADDPTKPWGQLAASGTSTLTLSYVTLENAGLENSSTYGALEVRADATGPQQQLLSVDHVTIRDAAGFGVSLRYGATFAKASSELTITGAKKAPLRLQPRLASTIPTGAYRGNADDAFEVETEGDISLEDVTFPSRGVPYRIGSATTFGELKVTGDRTLTLEPGVTLQFVKNEAAGLFVDSGTRAELAKGALVAVGTAEQPITFTSTEKLAGAWRGLVFGNQPNAKNRLEYVRIEYAGGASRANSYHCDPSGSFSKDEDAAFTVFGQPASAFMKSSTIADSAALGVNLAYSGDAVDFMSTNTFVRIATCKQSTPRQKGGACPTTVVCP